MRRRTLGFGAACLLAVGAVLCGAGSVGAFATGTGGVAPWLNGASAILYGGGAVFMFRLMLRGG